MDIKTTRTVTLGDFTVDVDAAGVPVGFTYLGARWTPMPQDRELIDKCVQALVKLHDVPVLTEADIVDTCREYAESLDTAIRSPYPDVRRVHAMLGVGAAELKGRLLRRLRGKGRK